MRDIGDQFALEMLGLHALGHGGVQPVADVVEILGVILQFPVEILRVDLALEIAACDLLRAKAQPPHVPDQEERCRAEKQQMQKPQHFAAAVGHGKHQQLQQQEGAEDQHPAAEQRQGPQAPEQKPSPFLQQLSAALPELDQQHILPERAELHTHGKAHAKEQEQERRAEHQDREGDIVQGAAPQADAKG